MVGHGYHLDIAVLALSWPCLLVGPLRRSIAREGIVGVRGSTGKRRAELIEDGEFGAELDGIHGYLVEALKKEESRVAKSHETAVEKDDENVDLNEVLERAANCLAVGAQQGHVLEVVGRGANVEDADDGLLDEEDGDLNLVPDEVESA